MLNATHAVSTNPHERRGEFAPDDSSYYASPNCYLRGDYRAGTLGKLIDLFMLRAVHAYICRQDVPWRLAAERNAFALLGALRFQPTAPEQKLAWQVHVEPTQPAHGSFWLRKDKAMLRDSHSYSPLGKRRRPRALRRPQGLTTTGPPGNFPVRSAKYSLQPNPRPAPYGTRTHAHTPTHPRARGHIPRRSEHAPAISAGAVPPPGPRSLRLAGAPVAVQSRVLSLPDARCARGRGRADRHGGELQLCMHGGTPRPPPGPATRSPVRRLVSRCESRASTVDVGPVGSSTWTHNLPWPSTRDDRRRSPVPRPRARDEPVRYLKVETAETGGQNHGPRRGQTPGARASKHHALLATPRARRPFGDQPLRGSLSGAVRPARGDLRLGDSGGVRGTTPRRINGQRERRLAASSTVVVVPDDPCPPCCPGRLICGLLGRSAVQPFQAWRNDSLLMPRQEIAITGSQVHIYDSRQRIRDTLTREGDTYENRVMKRETSWSEEGCIGGRLPDDQSRSSTEGQIEGGTFGGACTPSNGTQSGTETQSTTYTRAPKIIVVTM
ncbi:hypothetical protein BC628DRAFT_1337947 [Trametes gibbosa]|nr:hypothetical protein BC628DRAFT_1337947 [Trametes gibbosa]